MRIIAGTYRSRKLVAPLGLLTRPTSDRLRETLGSVLASRWDGARVADLYAGSGAVGLEALSRGAAVCCFAERAPAAIKALQTNLASLQVPPAHAVVDTRDVRALLADARAPGAPWDVVFLDPPYEAAEEYTRTLRALAAPALLAAGGIVVAEHSRKLPLPAAIGALVRSRVLEQGDACLSFFAVPGGVPVQV